MTDLPESPIDLAPLDADAGARGVRIAAGVRGRVAAARVEERLRKQVIADVARRLARYAVPAALTAAATLAAVVATRGSASRTAEPFASAVLGNGPVAQWVVRGEAPGMSEVIAVVNGAR